MFPNPNIHSQKRPAEFSKILHRWVSGNIACLTTCIEEKYFMVSYCALLSGKKVYIQSRVCTVEKKTDGTACSVLVCFLHLGRKYFWPWPDIFLLCWCFVSFFPWRWHSGFYAEQLLFSYIYKILPVHWVVNVVFQGQFPRMVSLFHSPDSL